MIYKALANSLRSVADQVELYLRKKRGIRGFKAEKAIHDDIACPTLHAHTRDFHILWVEVSESPYPNTLDRLVLDCIRLGLPVRLYMAVPKPSNPPPSGYAAELARARDFGVGLIEVEGSKVKIVQEPLSLSLNGLRPIPLERFPQKYREALAQAETTFRNGNPAKGCSEIYDEIEALCRRVAEKTAAKGMWTNPPANINFGRDPWASV